MAQNEWTSNESLKEITASRELSPWLQSRLQRRILPSAQPLLSRQLSGDLAARKPSILGEGKGWLTQPGRSVFSFLSESPILRNFDPDGNRPIFGVSEWHKLNLEWVHRSPVSDTSWTSEAQPDYGTLRSRETRNTTPVIENINHTQGTSRPVNLKQNSRPILRKPVITEIDPGLKEKSWQIKEPTAGPVEINLAKPGNQSQQPLKKISAPVTVPPESVSPSTYNLSGTDTGKIQTMDIPATTEPKTSISLPNRDSSMANTKGMPKTSVPPATVPQTHISPSTDNIRRIDPVNIQKTIIRPVPAPEIPKITIAESRQTSTPVQRLEMPLVHLKPEKKDMPEQPILNSRRAAKSSAKPLVINRRASPVAVPNRKNKHTAPVIARAPAGSSSRPSASVNPSPLPKEINTAVKDQNIINYSEQKISALPVFEPIVNNKTEPRIFNSIVERSIVFPRSMETDINTDSGKVDTVIKASGPSVPYPQISHDNNSITPISKRGEENRPLDMTVLRKIQPLTPLTKPAHKDHPQSVSNILSNRPAAGRIARVVAPESGSNSSIKISKSARKEIDRSIEMPVQKLSAPKTSLSTNSSNNYSQSTQINNSALPVEDNNTHSAEIKPEIVSNLSNIPSGINPEINRYPEIGSSDSEISDVPLETTPTGESFNKPSQPFKSAGASISRSVSGNDYSSTSLSPKNPEISLPLSVRHPIGNSHLSRSMSARNPTGKAVISYPVVDSVSDANNTPSLSTRAVPQPTREEREIRSMDLPVHHSLQMDLSRSAVSNNSEAMDIFTKPAYKTATGDNALTRPLSLDLPVVASRKTKEETRDENNSGIYRSVSDQPASRSQSWQSATPSPKMGQHRTVTFNQSANTASAQPVAASNEINQSKPDLKKLAQELYPYLKRMIIIDKERMPR